MRLLGKGNARKSLIGTAENKFELCDREIDFGGVEIDYPIFNFLIFFLTMKCK